MTSPSLQKKIADIFYPYVGIYSESGSPLENHTAAYVRDWLAGRPYFQAHPDHFGLYPIAGDFHNRNVAWALVRGSGRKTVVLMHHFDVVEVEDFGLLKPLALKPDELEAALKQNLDLLSAEARADLLSGEYVFGRGACDMKAGGAIQIALIDEYSQQTGFEGNLVLVAVPDEENLSAGMRAAVSLLAELQTRYDLDYTVMINSEPHQRKDPAVGVISAGSIGKIMPFIYARGVLSHAGLSPKGFNPLSILGDVIRRTEMSLELTEINPVSGEVSAPPTWLMARDSKVVYDVSMPLSAFGCLNVLMSLNRPQASLQTFYEICAASAEEITAQINRAADEFTRVAGRPARNQAWQTSVMTFTDYLASLKAARGAAFDELYRQAVEENGQAVLRGEKTTAMATWAILDRLAQLGDPRQPVVIVGLLPPFYPSVSYLDRPDFTAAIQHLHEVVTRAAQDKWSQTYQLEAYMGITDLSYSSLSVGEDVTRVISDNMPLFGRFYAIPFAEMSQISMPCMNIGPQGKDFHKISERVLREDLFNRTPELVQAAVQAALSWSAA